GVYVKNRREQKTSRFLISEKDDVTIVNGLDEEFSFNGFYKLKSFPSSKSKHKEVSELCNEALELPLIDPVLLNSEINNIVSSYIHLSMKNEELLRKVESDLENNIQHSNSIDLYKKPIGCGGDRESSNNQTFKNRADIQYLRKIYRLNLLNNSFD